MNAPGVLLFSTTETGLENVPPLGVMTGVATGGLVEFDVVDILLCDREPALVTVESEGF